MKITIKMVMDENPCEKYPKQRVEELWSGLECITESDVAYLEIPINDRAWLLGRMLGHYDPARVVARRIARDALGDRQIPDAYKIWLDTGDESLRDAAGDAARDAARYAARAAARDVAWDAARYAARAAAWDVAWYAARAAAWDAAWNASMEKYLGWMVDFLKGVKNEN